MKNRILPESDTGKSSPVISMPIFPIFLCHRKISKSVRILSTLCVTNSKTEIIINSNMRLLMGNLYLRRRRILRIVLTDIRKVMKALRKI